MNQGTQKVEQVVEAEGHNTERSDEPHGRHTLDVEAVFIVESTHGGSAWRRIWKGAVLQVCMYTSCRQSVGPAVKG